MGESPATAPESPAAPVPGDVLDGKYRLLRIVGEGGMGVVFEAMHVKLGQRVAIKVLQPSVAKDADLVSRFEREARAAGRLRGKNVARVIDVEAAPGQLAYMVMEFLEGHDLEMELSRREGRRLPAPEAVDIVLQACRAIAEAHAAGIVHRDLKPSNLFLCDESGELVVKLLDFGVSKMEGDASKLTSTQLVLGTVYYMSPEQVRSAKQVDARTDVWALSVILYELLAGHPPFLGSSTSVAVSIVNDEPEPLPVALGVPAGLEAAIRKGMAKKPDDRFAHVVAFARAIAPHGTAMATGGTSAPSTTRWYDEAASAVVVRPTTGGDVAMGTARTVHDSASSSSGVAPLVVVAAQTSPERETLASQGARRIAPRAAMGIALVMGVGAVVLAVSRAPAPHSAHGREELTPQPLAATTVVPSSEPSPGDASPASSAAATATVASAATAQAPPAAKPKTTRGAAHPSPVAPAPAPPPKASKEKPPLVAPF